MMLQKVNYSTNQINYAQCAQCTDSASCVIMYRIKIGKYVAQKTGLILDLRPANGRQRYFVTTSLTGWGKPRHNPENIDLYFTINHKALYFELGALICLDGTILLYL